MYTGCYTNIQLQPMTLNINMKCFHWVIISKWFLYTVCMTSFPSNKSFILMSCVIRVFRKQHNQLLIKIPIPCINDNMYWKSVGLILCSFSDILWLYFHLRIQYFSIPDVFTYCKYMHWRQPLLCEMLYNTYTSYAGLWWIHLQMIWYRIMN